MIKEVIFLCSGDSCSARTWSNVPYLFTQELERRGIIVRRVNVEPPNRLRQLYNHSVWKLSRYIWRNNEFSFIRTKLARYLSDRKARYGIEKYPHADLCIFVSFGQYNKWSSIPSLCFSDWTFKLLVERQGRTPYSFERKYYQIEDKTINSANYVVSLFRDCALRMKKDYPFANIYGFSTNVINNMYGKPLIENYILKKKNDANKILFIGNKWYKESLRLLIKAFLILKDQIEDLKLVVIGMTKDHTGIEDSRIKYHGYLQKDIEAERDTYYEELMSAKMIVNVAPTWGGYSSLIEAMYFYTPVIVAPYKEFVAEFGEEINFGVYNKEFSSQCLADNISILLQNNEYEKMCKAAHQRVENYTWLEFVNNILEIVK